MLERSNRCLLLIHLLLRNSLPPSCRTYNFSHENLLSHPFSLSALTSSSSFYAHAAREPSSKISCLRNYFLTLILTPRKKYIDSIKFLDTQGNKKETKYFNSFEEITLKFWFFKLKQSWEHRHLLCRLRSGHYVLNYSLYRCNLVADPSCPCDSPRQDANHIFYGCPYYDAQRTSLISQLEKHKKTPSPSLTIQKILKNHFSEVIHALRCFLNLPI